MNATEIIREAARLMRAHAADVCPSPWTVTSQSARYGAVVGQPGDEFPEDNGYGGHLIGESMSPASAAYVVAWEPAVALSVAAWLEACADSNGVAPHALAVAKAYLANPLAAAVAS